MDTNPDKMYVRDFKSLLIPSCSYYETQEDYKRKTGKYAPPYDISKRTKKWKQRELVPGQDYFSAWVLAEDPDSGDSVPDTSGHPFLINYSFTTASSFQCNLPTGVANEKLNPLPEAWLPLRPLEDYERLVYKSQLPLGAGLISVFSVAKVFVIDDRYKPADNVTTVEQKLNSILESLKRIEDKLSVQPMNTLDQKC